MDSTASPENSKMQKVFEGQSSGDIGDRISNLPEHILHYILSFLPTKYAVGTSVLATRWKYLWTSICNLDFCEGLSYITSEMRDNKLRGKKIFIDFVERVLRLLDVSDIVKFSLTCEELDAAHVADWISKAVRCNVQELILSITMEHPYIFPHCLFTFKSLRILKIESVTVFGKGTQRFAVNVPTSVCFANLNYLHLKNISFSGDQSVLEVSLSFPVLKEFILEGCTWLEIKTVSISTPALQMLTIDEGLNVGLHECEIKIYAKSLLSLKLTSCLLYKYSLCHISSLVSASLYVTCYNGTFQHLGSLLRGISNVKDLELSSNSIESLFPGSSVHMLTLSQLVHLRVKMFERGCTTAISGRQLVDLFCNMPNIEAIFFPDGLSSFVFNGFCQILGKTPDCFLPHLKVVDIHNFEWRRRDQWFIKFLMKSVRVMDKLTIKVTTSPHFLSRDHKQLGVIEELQKLANDSNCVVEFV